MVKKGGGLGSTLVLALVIVVLSIALVITIIRPDTPPDPNVIGGLKDLNELATARRTDFVFIEKESDSRWTPFITGETVRLVAVGDVEAGVDLKSLKGDDVQVNEKRKTVTINLPQPRILDVSLDEKQTRVYDRDYWSMASNRLERRPRRRYAR